MRGKLVERIRGLLKKYNMTIKKTSQGFKVVSHTGKALSKPNLTKAEAHKRLAVVEIMKKKNK